MWPELPPPRHNEGSTHSFFMALSTPHLYLCNTRSARAWQCWK
jgi:hypothetical protein